MAHIRSLGAQLQRNDESSAASPVSPPSGLATGLSDGPESPAAQRIKHIRSLGEHWQESAAASEAALVRQRMEHIKSAAAQVHRVPSATGALWEASAPLGAGATASGSGALASGSDTLTLAS